MCLPGRTGSDGTLLNVALISYSVYIEAPTLAHLLIHAQNARNFYADSPRSLIFSLFFLKSPRISGAGSPAGPRICFTIPPSSNEEGERFDGFCVEDYNAFM